VISQGQLSFLLSSASSINFGYMNQQNRSMKNFSSANASWNRRVHETAYLTAGMNYLAGSPRPVLASVGIVIRLGARRMATATSNVAGGTAPAAIDVSEQVPMGTGTATEFTRKLAQARSKMRESPIRTIAGNIKWSSMRARAMRRLR
jgi:hypothetical protein